MTPSSTVSTGFLRGKEERLRARSTRRRSQQEQALRDAALALPPPPSFSATLTSGTCLTVIAEYKRRSPAAGALPVTDERPDDVAVAYVGGGARALSVLTDLEDFGGSLEDLRDVHRACDGRVPLLRKDFIIHDAALSDARMAGAAAVLLIVGMLRDDELANLLREAAALQMDTLIEVHDDAEFDRALAAGARIIGLNNRDLQSLTTDLGVTERLARRAPGDTIVVSESGIRDAGDVERVRDAGAHAVLVGDALLRMRGAARQARVRELAGVRR